jgi:uncharacterized protein (DUF1778 family)
MFLTGFLVGAALTRAEKIILSQSLAPMRFYECAKGAERVKRLLP